MSDAVIIALITNLALVVIAGLNLIATLRVGKRVDKVEKNTNGLVEDKVAAARKKTRIETRAETLAEIANSGLVKLNDDTLN